MTPTFALSVSEEVEKLGAYAGFASVLGLAVLALLYFASAREVKRLREWADRAPERVADLEARMAEISRRRAVAPQPVGKAAPGTGAQPATAAAAKVAAAKKPAAPGVAPVAANGADAAKKPAPAPAEGVAPGAPPADLTEIKRPPKKPAPAPGEQTLVGAAGRELRQNRPTARPRPQSTVRPSTARLMESARASNAQRRQGAPPGAAEEPPSQGRGRRIALVAGALAAIAVVAVLLVTVVFGGGGEEQAPQTNTIAPSTAPQETSAATVDRASTEVAILNGTTFSGLASSVANTLENAGFKRGEVTNAPDQTRSATIVEYTEGHKPEALEVARSIPGVASDAVVAISEGSRVLAPSAAVVVTVGSDQTPSAGQ